VCEDCAGNRLTTQQESNATNNIFLIIGIFIIIVQNYEKKRYQPNLYQKICLPFLFVFRYNYTEKTINRLLI
jgi:hypothetical protein